MGPRTIAAVLAVVLLRNQESRTHLKNAAKIALRAGYKLKESCGEMVNKAKDYGEDLIAEVKVEEDQKVRPIVNREPTRA